MRGESGQDGAGARAGAAVVLLDVDSTGDLVVAGLNPAGEQLLGLSGEAIAGKRLAAVRGPASEPARRLRTACQRCLAAGGAIHSAETRLGSPPGAWGPLQLAPVRDAAGRTIRIIASATALTQAGEGEQSGQEWQYRALVENLPELIVRYDRDLRRRYVNPAWTAASGLSAAAIPGADAARLPHEPDPIAEPDLEALRRVLATGVPETQRCTWVDAGGERLHIEYRVIPEYGPDGSIRGLLGVGHDVTAYERAKSEHQKSRDLLRAIIEAAPTAIIGLDLDGKVHTVWNPAAERMLGWSADEAMGQPLPSVPSEDQEEFSRFRDRIRRGLTLDGVDVRRRRRDGTPIDYSIYASPLHDAGGGIVGNVAVLVETTERRRHQNILQARLRLLAGTSSRTMDELLTLTLDELEALTASSIGFYHFLKADQRTLSLQNWSTNTLKHLCTAAGRGQHYDLAQAGVWADCVRERRAIIHNDYAALPGRRGLPPGHAPVLRELVVPVFRGDQIRAIVGVGNKASAYDDNDLEIVAQLADLSWDLVERMQAEETLKRSEVEKTILNQMAKIFLTVPGEAMYGEVLAIILRAMRSETGIFGYLEASGDLVVPHRTEGIGVECQIRGTSLVFPAAALRSSPWGWLLGGKRIHASGGQLTTPSGHGRNEHELAVPIVHGQDAIGLIAVANKAGGYGDEERSLLERVAHSISPILHARLETAAQERRRVAVEEELRESEEKYRLLITNADEAIFIVQDAIVRFPNPKAVAMSGLPAHELAGIPFRDLVHPDDREWVSERYIEGRSEPPPAGARAFRIVDGKGGVRWAQLITAPVTWESRAGTLCFLRDVTEAKRLEAQLVQAQKMEAVGRLAGGVAHDFNNMLSVILGHAEMALATVPPDDPLHARLGEIEMAAHRSANLTRQLLAFARQQTITPQTLNLNEIVPGMLSMLGRLIGEDIALDWRPQTDLWLVEMDPGQIDQVLANLCVNARDAIAGVGMVSIETKNATFDAAYCTSHAGFVTGDFVMLAVSDDGCGMSEELRAHIFEPFFTTKGPGVGTGLGLATVYGIVKQNRGFVNVYSEEGKGTTLRVYFPRHAAGSETSRAGCRATGQLLRGSETILVVEDEAGILALLDHMLSGLGYRVLSASTPRQAMQLAAEHVDEIQLLITDVIMPEMNGPELVKRLRPRRPDLKCLFMSGYTGGIIAERGILDEGALLSKSRFRCRTWPPACARQSTATRPLRPAIERATAAQLTPASALSYSPLRPAAIQGVAMSEHDYWRIFPRMPRAVRIGDITVRDGFQHLEKFISTRAKLYYLEELIFAGCKSIEVTNLGSPHLMPQFADAEILLAHLKSEGFRQRCAKRGIDLGEVVTTAVTIRESGVDRAVELAAKGVGPDRLLMMVSTEEEHHFANSGCTLPEYWREAERSIRKCHDAGMAMCGTVSTIWGSPIGGATTLEDALDFTRRWLAIGADDIEHADHDGSASAPEVYRYFAMTLDALPDTKLHIAHFHETKRVASASVLAALQAGITQFEATLGGLGGQPANFLDDSPVPGTGDYYYKDPRYVGLVCLEDLIVMVDEMGIAHGYDVDRILKLGRQMDKTVGFRTRAEAPINGRTLKEGHPGFARPGLAARKAKLGEALGQKLPPEWPVPAELPARGQAKRA